MPGVKLYPFRHRDPLTGKWIRARYRATHEEIAARYAEWEVVGPPEIRDFEQRRGFHPFPLMTHAEPARALDQAPDMQPLADACERFLLAVFLRRYVTWCARKRRMAQAEGAAELWRRVAEIC